MSEKVTPEAVLKAYQDRDAAAKNEQNLEDDVFSPTKEFSEAEIQAIIRRYRQLKDIRAAKALKAAEMFMHLTPDERAEVTAAWRTSQEGKRKAATTGVRGK